MNFLILFILPMILGFWAQHRVKSTFAKNLQIGVANRGRGSLRADLGLRVRLADWPWLAVGVLLQLVARPVTRWVTTDAAGLAGIGWVSRRRRRLRFQERHGLRRVRIPLRRL